MDAKPQKIIIIGAGGLGCAVSLSLASTINTAVEILVCDYDEVELSNLNRQVLFSEESIGQPKAKSLCSAIERIYPSTLIRWNSKHIGVNSENAKELLQGADIVVDATDNPDTKFFLNSFCVENQIPLIHAAAAGLRAQVMAINPAVGTACLRCVFEEVRDLGDTCQQAGILGAFVGSVGLLQAELVRKALKREYKNYLHSFTMTPWRVKKLEFEPDPLCSVCSKFQKNTSKRYATNP